MNEAVVKQRIKNALDAQCAAHMDVYWFMPPANGYGRAGIPDFVICVSGHFMAIEAKGKGGHTTALQDRELANIKRAGGQALEINHTHEIEAVVAAMCDIARLRKKENP